MGPVEEGRITFFSGVPTMYVKMMQHFVQDVANSGPGKLEYAEAAKQMRGMLCGTSRLAQPVHKFWETLRDGKRILDRYGSSETGLIFRMPLQSKNVPDGSVGLAAAGVEIKFKDGGDEGELLIKNPNMFMGYDLPSATV